MENGSWQHKRTLTPHQLKTACKALSLNKGQLSRYSGIKIRRVYRMLNGEAEIPVTLALLLSGMVERGDVPVVPKWVKE